MLRVALGLLILVAGCYDFRSLSTEYKDVDGGAGDLALVFPATCSNMVKDSTESDVDCGGLCGPTCPGGRACGSNRDCQGNVCQSKVCITPMGTCTDGARNSAETDVDCGGAVCPKCGNGKVCLFNGDCESGRCSSGKLCVPFNTFTCSDAITCAAACGDAPCRQACGAKINSPSGPTRWSEMSTCLDEACKTANMGPCDKANPGFPGTCDTCRAKAATTGGACFIKTNVCKSDQ
ncbi:MAG: hypothetical protein EXR72_13800 [Myxococcales bacterium]|nr:hypothetical protein [Myxococcales bacterium]